MDSNILKYVEKDRFANYLGIELLEAKRGYALVQLEINDNHKNGVGLVHGGVIFTVADYAFAVAANAYENTTLSINATISYYKSPKGDKIIAEASEIKTNKKICGYNVDIFDSNKELVAKFSAIGYVKTLKN